jgi:hypothetical protein
MDCACFLRRFACSACLVLFAVSLSDFPAWTSHAASPVTQTLAVEGKFREPANSDYYYYLDPQTGALDSLELLGSKPRAINRYLGLGGTMGAYELSNGRSSLRIKSGQPQEFLIRWSARMGVDRNSERIMKEYVYLVRASSRNDRREVVTTQWPLMGRVRINEDKIPCDVKAYGEDSVLVIPHEVLPQGEYAFWGYDRHYNSEMEQAFYAFGVDPSGIN